MKKVFYFILPLLLIGALVAGYAKDVDAGDPITIGICDDVSGFSADSGRAERDGGILCIEEWNKRGGIKGSKIEYAFRDNAGDPTKATTIAKEFVRMGVVAVHGGTTSTVAIPEIKVLTEAQIPEITHSASMAQFDTKGPDGKLYAFCICSNPALAVCAIELSKTKKWKKVAIVHLNAAWPKDLARIQAEGIAKEPGMELVGTIVADLKATDLTREAVEVKAMNPDVIYTTLYSSTYIPWFRALNDLKYHPPMTGYWGMAEGAYLAIEKELCYNFYGSSTYNLEKPVVKEKLAQFKARFKYDPTGTWVGGWDMMNVLLTAIEKAGTKGPAIRDWLATKSTGMDLIGGNEKAKCRFEEGSKYHETYKFGLLGAQDLAFSHITKDGKLTWLK